MIFRMYAVTVLFVLLPAVCAISQPIQDTAKARTMSLDVKDTDIKDVIRMISKGYGLNVILDRDITGTVTLHLTEVPIIEGLTTLAESNGWELAKDGSVYRIRKPVDEKKSLINYSRGLLTLDIQNINVLDFLKEISSKAAVSIVPDSKISGKVTGKLYRVPLEDGFKAVLEGNGFTVKKRRNIFHVSQEESSGVAEGGTPSRRYRGPKTDKGDFFVECSDERMTIDVQNANLSDVINAVSEQCDIEIITYENLTGVVNAKLNDIPLTKGLALLLGGTRFTFVQKENIILIGDRNTATPSGQTLSKSELINLKHIKADEIPKILPKNIPPTNIQIIKEQNALLVSGTSEDIVKTAEFLETVDIPTPQVVIDVIVVEYTRDLTRDFGLEFASNKKGDAASNYYSFPEVQINRAGDEARYLMGKVFGESSFISHLSPDFFMTLRLLESQQKAKVLAQPSITVLNGNKATIDVGQTQYFKVEGGTENNPTLNFRPIKFGITLNITPWISKSGQITAEINPEISNAMGGATVDGYPNVFSRSVNTTVRIDQGKTLIIGGLLRTEEQISHKKVPLLGDIPILGYLFKTTKKIQIQTNLVLYITPKIIGKGSYVNLEKEMEQFSIDEKRGVFKKRDYIKDTVSIDNNDVDEIKDTTGIDSQNGKNSMQPDSDTHEPAKSSTVAPVKKNPDNPIRQNELRKMPPRRIPAAVPETNSETTDIEQPDTVTTDQE